MEQRCYGCMQIKQNDPICEHCGFDGSKGNNAHQLPMGTEVGQQYILGRVLGQGGFGITYMGWDKVMQQRVAVKEYFPSGYAGRDPHDLTSIISYDTTTVHSFEDNKRRFLREADSLAKLRDIPNIVQVLRYFEENGTAYIAMEYAEGMDLQKYLKQLGQPMTMVQIRNILEPVMAALEQVHKAELVHRDISPDNIMVLPDGSAKLLDFGAARYVENADAAKDRNTSTQAVLKHGFAPPEQYRSHGALGPWSDVYAVCATIYFCLTGRVPVEAMTRIMENPPIGWEKIEGLTEQQVKALNSGMAIKPQDRIQSVQELKEQLFGKIQEAQPRAEEKQSQEEEAQPRAEEVQLLKEQKEQPEPESGKDPAPESAETESRKEAEPVTPVHADQETDQKLREQKQIPELINQTTGEAKAQQIPRSDKPGKGRKLAVLLAAVAAAAIAVGFLMKSPGPAAQEDPEMSAAEQIATETAALEENAVPETTVQETTVPETTIPQPQWKNNILKTSVKESDAWKDVPEWWEANAHRYSGFSQNGTITLWDVDVIMPMTAYEEFQATYPVYNTGIPRNQVSKVIFLDTTAEAPEDCWDVSLYGNGSVLAWAEPAQNGMYALTIAAEGGINGGQAAECMFRYFTKLQEVEFNGCLHLEEAKSTVSMFEECTSLKSLDLSSLVTSNVTNMMGMFTDCSALTELDASSFDTSKVTFFSSMFFGCEKLETLDLSTFDTSSATNMNAMFGQCNGLKTLDISSFDTSKVTNMSMMFYTCTCLSKLDLHHFNTENVTDMSRMFYKCSFLSELDTTGWNTANLKKTEDMFAQCDRLPGKYKNIGNT